MTNKRKQLSQMQGMLYAEYHDQKLTIYVYLPDAEEYLFILKNYDKI